MLVIKSARELSKGGSKVRSYYHYCVGFPFVTTEMVLFHPEFPMVKLLQRCSHEVALFQAGDLQQISPFLGASSQGAEKC